DSAAAELRAARKDAASGEVRQALQRQLDRVEAGTPEALWAQRAIEALESFATPAAKDHLKALAGGPARATLTDAATAARRRLDGPRRGRADHLKAEDAFPATFLAPARQPGRRVRQAPRTDWLYTVAYRLARKARARAVRRRWEPLAARDLPAPAAEPPDALGG